jgi:putative FmdB family regulatory protein
MPIYEFKCLKCNEYFELLMMNSDEGEPLGCPHCQSEAFERIISSVNYAMGNGSGSSKGASVQTRNCSGGSCTTYDIPGPS